MKLTKKRALAQMVELLGLYNNEYRKGNYVFFLDGGEIYVRSRFGNMVVSEKPLSAYEKDTVIKYYEKLM